MMMSQNKNYFSRFSFSEYISINDILNDPSRWMSMSIYATERSIFVNDNGNCVCLTTTLVVFYPLYLKNVYT